MLSVYRFVILKRVPRDLLTELRVPKRIMAYLDTPFYYSEQIADWADLEPSRGGGEGGANRSQASVSAPPDVNDPDT